MDFRQFGSRWLELSSLKDHLAPFSKSLPFEEGLYFVTSFREFLSEKILHKQERLLVQTHGLALGAGELGRVYGDIDKKAVLLKSTVCCRKGWH